MNSRPYNLIVCSSGQVLENMMKHFEKNDWNLFSRTFLRVAISTKSLISALSFSEFFSLICFPDKKRLTCQEMTFQNRSTWAWKTRSILYGLIHCSWYNHGCGAVMFLLSVVSWWQHFHCTLDVIDLLYQEQYLNLLKKFKVDV